MAMFSSREEHAANPPSTWVVAKSSGGWGMGPASGGEFCRYPTEKTALQATREGRWVGLYEKEARWYAGEQVDNWRPYVEPDEEFTPADPAVELRHAFEYALYILRHGDVPQDAAYRAWSERLNVEKITPGLVWARNGVTVYGNPAANHLIERRDRMNDVKRMVHGLPANASRHSLDKAGGIDDYGVMQEWKGVYLRLYADLLDPEQLDDVDSMAYMFRTRKVVTDGARRECPSCKFKALVSSDGRFLQHNKVDVSYSRTKTDLCPGSGQRSVLVCECPRIAVAAGLFNDTCPIHHRTHKTADQEA